MTTVDVALWICVRICIYLNIEYTRTCFCIGKMRIKHSTFRHAWCLMVSVFPDGMDDYDVSTKACINLGPRYLRRRTQTTEQAQRPANHAKPGYIGGLQGAPLCGCKNGSNCLDGILVFMVGLVEPATSRRTRRSTSISHKSGTSEQGI